MPKHKSTAAITLDADGIKISAWAETDGDVHLTLDGQEEVILSSISANIIGLALLQLAEPEDEA